MIRTHPKQDRAKVKKDNKVTFKHLRTVKQSVSHGAKSRSESPRKY